MLADIARYYIIKILLFLFVAICPPCITL